MKESHIFHLGEMPPQKVRSGGSRADAKKPAFPVLSGMSLSILSLKPKAAREPHWHPNAHELSYCLEGTAVMTIFGAGNTHDTFKIEAGDIAYVPMGFLHHIENVGEKPLKMAIAFNHETPEDLEISSGVSVMSDRVLSATLGANPAFFEKFTKTVEPAFITEVSKHTTPQTAMATNRYKMRLEASQPEVNTPGGKVRMSNGTLLPTMKGIAVYSVALEKNGVREPHWHPNAHELNYLISGSARITLLSPGGAVDTFDMKPGDISFLPRGYFHDIENTGSGPARLAVFFSHDHPSDIGLSGCMGAYSNEVLASLFKIDPETLSKLPKFQEDLFVVPGGG
jgi:oxalate decarboxylase